MVNFNMGEPAVDLDRTDEIADLILERYRSDISVGIVKSRGERIRECEKSWHCQDGISHVKWFPYFATPESRLNDMVEGYCTNCTAFPKRPLNDQERAQVEVTNLGLYLSQFI